MLIYRGMSQIGSWNMSDVAQILKGISLCKLSAKVIQSRIFEESHKSPSLGGSVNERPSIIECELYTKVLNVIEDFLEGIREFDNPPPIAFKVEGNKITLFAVPLVIDLQNHPLEIVLRFEEGLVLDIKNQIGNVGIVSVCRDKDKTMREMWKGFREYYLRKKLRL